MKTVQTKYLETRYIGSKSMYIVQKVVEGPQSLVGRTVELKISFDQLDEVMKRLAEARAWLAKSEQRAAEVSARNAE